MERLANKLTDLGIVYKPVGWEDLRCMTPTSGAVTRGT